MSEMIERVARAVWEKRRELALARHGVELESWGDGSYPRGNHIFEETRTAIEAMMQPTEAMLKNRMKGTSEHDAIANWKMMIDEALK